MSAFDQDRERHAAAWITKLQSRSVSTHDLADFARWRRDPENAAAYEHAEAFWEQCGELRRDPDMVEAVQSALSGSQRERRSPWSRSSVRMISAVTVALAVIALFLIVPPAIWPNETRYATMTGERSLFSLKDGSRVQLDTASEITADISARSRVVNLNTGRAFFDVQHDARRPFVVNVDDAVTVTAHGTKFDVFRRDNDVDVILYQGSVEVADRVTGRSVRLAPGQWTRSLGGELSAPKPARVDQFSSWRSGRLSFSDTPLSEAIAQVNRYTDRPVRLARPDLSSDPVSGEFSSEDVDGFVAATNAIYGAGALVRSEAVR